MEMVEKEVKLGGGKCEVLKTGSMIKPKRLPIHNLGVESMVEPRSHQNKLRLKRSPIDDLTDRLDPIFKNTVNGRSL